VSYIDRLRIQGLRNLGRIDLNLPRGVVWLVGPNGSGKTTLLEAVYLLSRGASFRGRRFGPLTTRGARSTRIEGRIARGEQRFKQSWSCGNGTPTEFTGGQLSIRLIGSSMHALLEGEPALRRRFIDWNVFHVEPGYAQLRAQFRRVAGQRNAWLRSGGRGPPVWDANYADMLLRIAGIRARFFGRIRREFLALTKQFPAFDGIEPCWHSGVAEGEDVLALLAQQREGDVARGHTVLSPGRADFSLTQGGVRWVGSRGQNKFLGMLLQLSADRVVREAGEDPAVWLVDDPSAELDPTTLNSILPLIFRASEQTVVTSVVSPPEPIVTAWRPNMFHVEQGQLISGSRA